MFFCIFLLSPFAFFIKNTILYFLHMYIFAQFNSIYFQIFWLNIFKPNNSRLHLGQQIPSLRNQFILSSKEFNKINIRLKFKGLGLQQYIDIERKNIISTLDLTT